MQTLVYKGVATRLEKAWLGIFPETGSCCPLAGVHQTLESHASDKKPCARDSPLRSVKPRSRLQDCRLDARAR